MRSGWDSCCSSCWTVALGDMETPVNVARLEAELLLKGYSRKLYRGAKYTGNAFTAMSPTNARLSQRNVCQTESVVSEPWHIIFC